MKIREIMTREVKTVGPQEDARSVYQKLTGLGVHHVPVVDAGKVVGILSTTDYRGLVHGAGKGGKITTDMVFGGLSVGALMTKDPLTLPPDATVTSAASVMLKHGIHAVPVVEDGALQGILTSNDILSAVSKGTLA